MEDHLPSGKLNFGNADPAAFSSTAGFGSRFAVLWCGLSRLGSLGQSTPRSIVKVCGLFESLRFGVIPALRSFKQEVRQLEQKAADIQSAEF
jgi:hypothetical protein